MNAGFLYALGAYMMWGLFPMYFKLMQEVPALQVISHRIIWSFVFLFGFILLARQWPRFRAALNLRVMGLYLLAGALLSVNWLVYIWGVNAGYILETSLGYYINPLVSIVLARIFLGERLRPLQTLPVVLATAAVLYLTYAYGSLPWIALTLAVTFGCYGLVKKIATLGSLHGLTLETGFVVIPALLYLAFLEVQGTNQFGHTSPATSALMIGAGIVTIVPLLLFASATSRISLTMIGIMQYIAPTIQFFIAVYVYHESFSKERLIGFSLIWVALILFTAEGLYEHRKRKRRYAIEST